MMASATNLQENYDFNSSSSDNASGIDSSSCESFTGKPSVTNFYFENTPRTRSNLGSPRIQALKLNLKEYQSSAATRNRHIYSIDELSEATGRSELLMLHEREHFQKVKQIIEYQHATRMQRQASRPSKTRMPMDST